MEKQNQTNNFPYMVKSSEWPPHNSVVEALLCAQPRINRCFSVNPNVIPFNSNPIFSSLISASLLLQYLL